jgi:hypothetical protein
MGEWIKCTKGCADKVWVGNILDQLSHRGDHNLFKCSCGHDGYIEKSFALQEKGDEWKPFLRGAISLGETGDIYQPFVYVVSDEPDSEITALWFSYYKDTRASGGRLKLGYGPGGPPVLSTNQVRSLLKSVEQLGVPVKDDAQS